MEFKHQLRVCNAYPDEEPLDIVRATETLTESAMHYKECRSFSVPIKTGDKLDFKVGNANAGTFTIDELPSNDATMLLVIYRHDTRSTTVSFASHVYSNLLNAQISVIDAYRGKARSGITIRDHAGASAGRAEELRYNSVVALNAGTYDIVLDGTKVSSPLAAVDRETYAVIRVGVEAEQGKAYPQELIVFPHSLGGSWGVSILPVLALIALHI